MLHSEPSVNALLDACEPVPMTPPPLSAELLYEMIQAESRTRGDGHKRLRETLIQLAEQMQELEQARADDRAKLVRLETILALPLDLSRSTWPTRHVVGFFGTVLTLIAVIIGASYSVKSDVRDVATSQAAQTKLEDERIVTLRAALDEVKKDLALQRIKTDELTNKVLDTMRKLQ